MLFLLKILWLSVLPIILMATFIFAAKFSFVVSLVLTVVMYIYALSTTKIKL